MSWITDVVVHVDYAPPELRAAITEEFHAGVYGSGNPRIERLVEVPLSDGTTYHHGGGKVFTGHVYAGSYNHLDREALLAWLRDLPWGRYSHAVVSIAGESEFYGVYRVAAGEFCEVEWSRS